MQVQFYLNINFRRKMDTLLQFMIRNYCRGLVLLTVFVSLVCLKDEINLDLNIFPSVLQEMATKRILVYGGKGALGSVCVDTFKAQKWWVGSIDSKVNDAADANIVVDSKSDIFDQEKLVLDQLQSTLNGEKLDAIICVAGGWAGGNASSKDFVSNCVLTYKQSSVTSILAASIASKLLKEGGLLTFTGSAAALDPTPGMIGYGMFKASVHHLTKSLGAPKSGLPADSTVVAILPVTLDTPMNRKFMPKANFSTWTPLDFVSNLLIKWCNNELRPPSGSLLKLETENNQTQTKIV